MTYYGEDSVTMDPAIVTPLSPAEESALKPVYEPKANPLPVLIAAALIFSA